MPLSGDTDTYAEGSANTLVLGDGVVRPFRGFSGKGTNSGSRIAVQLGDSWGGLQDYGSTTAQGSFIKDALRSLYAIGAGKLAYEGVKVQIRTGSFNLASNTDINTTTDVITKTAHGLVTGQAVLISASTTMPTVTGTALTSTTSYFAIVLTADTFRLARTYSAALAGTPYIDFTSDGAGTITFTYGADATASSVLQIASTYVNNTFYNYFDQAGLAQPDAPNVSVPITPGTGYTGLVNGAIAFKIAAIRDRANTGQNVDTVGPIPVKSIASTTSNVVVPVNQTVKIQFPTAASGQTHWAVFATKQGFGGTGVFLRIGYRTSSANDAIWYWAISETTVAAATDRTLEFDFQDGDLYPEDAWLLDYQPPPGTHFLRLENCGVVLGCYDGTVCAVSLPNFMESYNPFHLLYLAEPVTAVLHRQTDDFAYVAGRNSIYALQYVGFRGDDLPSATVTTVSPDVGIAKQHNWAQAGNTIVAFLEGKGLVRLLNDRAGDIAIDYEFGKEVAWLTKDWTADNTVIGWDPDTQSVVAGCGNVSVSFSYESLSWSAPVYISDAGVTGTWLSATNSRGEMIVSLNNAGTHTAYAFDDNASTTIMPTVAISRWLPAVGGARSVNIYECETAIRQGTSTEPLVMGVHTNLYQTYTRLVGTTSGSATLTASSPIFDRSVTGKWVAVLGTGVGNQVFTASLTSPPNALVLGNSAAFITGQAVWLSSTGTLPAGLQNDRAYYVIRTSSTTSIQLATTPTNAFAGTAIVLGDVGTGTHTLLCNLLIAKVTYATAVTVTMTSPYTGASITAGATNATPITLIGRYFRQMISRVSSEEHLVNLRPAIQNARSVAVSVYQRTDAATGAVFNGTIFGTPSDSSVISTI